MQKHSKIYEQQITNSEITQITDAIKIISYYLIIMLFSICIYTYSAKTVLNEFIGSFGPYLEIIAICYYVIVLKEENKKQKHTTNIILIKKRL